MNIKLIGASLFLVFLVCVLPPLVLGTGETGGTGMYSAPDLLLKTITDTDMNVIVACGEGGGSVPSHCAVLAAQYPVREAVRSIALAAGLKLSDKGIITVVASRDAVSSLAEPLVEIDFNHEQYDLLGIIRNLTDAFGRMGMEFKATLRDETVVFSVSESGRQYMENYLELVKAGQAVETISARVFPPEDEYISIKSVRTGLSHAVRLLLRQAGINFVSTVPLQGEVIVNLDNVHYMRALRLMLRVYGLDYKPIPNGILVEPLADK